MTKMQLIWNVLSMPEEHPPKQEFTFVFVNEPREIDIMQQRAREILTPTDNEITITEGLIKASRGLHYKAIKIDTYVRMTPEDFDPRKIYDPNRGKIKRDEKLGNHRTIDGLAIYVDNMFAR